MRSWVIDQNILTILNHKLKLCGLLKFRCHFWIFLTICYYSCIILRKSVYNFEIAKKNSFNILVTRVRQLCWNTVRWMKSYYNAASNNCFSNRDVFRNSVNALSKMVKNFSSKKFYFVLFGPNNFVQTQACGPNHYCRNVWRDCRLLKNHFDKTMTPFWKTFVVETTVWCFNINLKTTIFQCPTMLPC